MERSEETLTTRDLAQPNEPAPAGADVGTTSGGGAVPAGTGQPRATTSGLGGDPGSPTGQDLSSQQTNASAGGAGAVGTGGTQDAAASSAGDSAPLLPAEASSSFQLRWKEVQTRFVDEPRGAVKEADELVANLMQQLADGFAQERARLEAVWDRGEDISTEDLRVALQRYRSFFQRLLSA